MIKRLFAIFTAMLVLAFSTGAHAQFKIATGDKDKGSIYGVMTNNFMEMCPTEGVSIVVTPGSTKSMELLTANQVSGIWVQGDFLHYVKNNDPQKVANVKALFGLHPEALQFVARAKIKTGGVLGFGAKDVIMNDISQLAGRNIGAVGGSVTSAWIVSARTKLNYKVAEYRSNTDLAAALADGKVDAALFVAGTDYDFIKKLSRDFKLLTISPKEQTLLVGEGAPYTPVSVTYENLGQVGVRTVATQAVFATYDYKSPKFRAILSSMKACFHENLISLSEEPGNSPMWRRVDAKKTAGWPVWSGD